MTAQPQSSWLDRVRAAFGERLQEQVPLARYTAARLGGPADALLTANSSAELAEIVSRLWEIDVPFMVLGGGSNVLVSDRGVRGVVVLNRAKDLRFDPADNPPSVWAESGVNMGSLARQAAARGLPGLEWAAGIPGTVGGAVVGNAGAHGSDLAANLLVAEILHHNFTEGRTTLAEWPVERLEYAYRTSLLKRSPGQYLVLAARLKLEQPFEGSQDIAQARIDTFTEYRKRTQPPGASMGSMFKNPPGDFAGRLIDAAGLKGARVGDAQISSLHANFFINNGQASAEDVYQLICMAQNEVSARLGIKLELEVELVGDWEKLEGNYA